MGALEEVMSGWSAGGDSFLVDRVTSTVVAIGNRAYLKYFTVEPRSRWSILEWDELTPEMIEKLRNIAALMSELDGQESVGNHDGGGKELEL